MHTIICTICCESLCDDNMTRICSLPCGHIFHGNCVNIWLSRSQTCPHCRVYTTQDKVLKLFFEVSELADPEHPSQEALLAELKRTRGALENMDKLTQQLNELSTVNGSLRHELNILSLKVLKYKTLVSDQHKQKEELSKALNALKEERQKTENLTGQIRKYQKIKKLLNGSVEEATEVIDSGSLDIVTMKSCYMTIKRNFTALVNSETKLKADYSSLYSAFQKLKKSTAEVNEQLLIQNKIIESCKSEQKISLKRAVPEEATPSTSSADKSTGEPSPKKRTVHPLRRSGREFISVSTVDLFKMKSSMIASEFGYDGFGGHSRVDKFPVPKLRGCKIVTNRKK